MRRAPTLALLGLALLAPVPAALAAPSAAERKARVDQRLREAREQLERTRAAERRTQASVTADTAEIRRLAVRLADLRGRLDELQTKLAPGTTRLAELREQRREADLRLSALEDSQARVRQVATERLVAMYRTGEPDPVAVMLSGTSLLDALQVLQEVRRIADADRRLFDDLADAERNVGVERQRAVEASRRLRAAAAALFDEEAHVELATERASRANDALERRRSDRQAKLAQLTGDRQEVEAETKELERQSSALTARILRASLPADGVRVPQSAGVLQWPCAGPITSNFGFRWGRMHEGLDIGCSFGQTIVAAGAGTIIYAGPQGGYGNIILIQHSPSLVTAYAHQSSFIRTSGHVEAGTTGAIVLRSTTASQCCSSHGGWWISARYACAPSSV